MNIVIFGPPGAGKGTQSKYIVKKFNLFQLSTGELLRNEIINKTQLGLNISSIMNSGNLVSDKIVSDLIEIYISNNDYNDRLIFDGYPRNISQAENLNLLLKKFNKKIDLVLKLSVSIDMIKSKSPKAIILSGGPASVFNDDAPAFDKNILNINIPILGICYGLHLLVHHNGGIVECTGEGEYGVATLKINKPEGVTNNMSSSSEVWMSHMDQVTLIPKNWEVIAHSSNNIVAALANNDHTRIATQFHPEVSHTEEGDILLNNFLFNISKCEKNWTASNFIQEKIENLNLSEIICLIYACHKNKWVFSYDDFNTYEYEEYSQYGDKEKSSFPSLVFIKEDEIDHKPSSLIFESLVETVGMKK